MPNRIPNFLSKDRIIVILGPTAGGKSELAVSLAESLYGEVIGADSMQVYRDLNAATAKPDADQLARAKHHMINVVEPNVSWTVADWLSATEHCIKTLHEASKVPIIVGGTNLYIRALLEGLFEGPPADQAFRASLDDQDNFQLYDQLKIKDPLSAERIKPNDRKRIIRALEVLHLTGESITIAQKQWSDARDADYRFNPVILGLKYEAEQINPRINARVKGMFEPIDGSCGVIEETQLLRDQGRLGEQAAKALGTAQAIDVLEGRLSRKEAIEQTKILTRRFAKQQRTWLRRFRNVQWISAADHTSQSLLEEAIRRIEQELQENTSPK